MRNKLYELARIIFYVSGLKKLQVRIFYNNQNLIINPHKALRLVSYDKDGTLAWGKPPGPITKEKLEEERAKGSIIGGASSRPPREQLVSWQEAGIPPDFVVNKVDLAQLKVEFEANEYIHVGDDGTDKYSAKRARFKFLYAQEVK